MRQVRARLDIEPQIITEEYFTAAQGVKGADMSRVNPHRSLETLVFCVLVLRNGATVVGVSFCDRPEEYDPEISQDIARARAADEARALLRGTRKATTTRG